MESFLYFHPPFLLTNCSTILLHMLTWEEFEKVEMRVGTILEARDFEKARNPAYQLTIDFGDYGIKRSSAQITTLYSKDELPGKQVIAVVNFPPKQIANFFSECLVLGLVGADKEITLLQPERPVANGLRVA
nr:tRNA-binding protein [Haliscomenobacter sp.]